MSKPWGHRDGAGNWLNPRPVWTLAALVIATLSAVAVEAYQYADLRSVPACVSA
jgi:hypothetical protein